MKKAGAGLLAAVLIAMASWFIWREREAGTPADKPSPSGVPAATFAPYGGEGLSYASRVNGDTFQVYENGSWRDLKVKGVNMGMAKPGAWPGEAAVTEEEYSRWLGYISEMNANVIRVYTLHPPGFYKALEEFNRTHERKLYLLQGVWANEEKLLETMDARHNDNTGPFKDEIRRLADVIHGSAEVLAQPGHASGSYSADVSPYVLGWVLGIEWDPNMVQQTNKAHAGTGEFKGEYAATDGAAPFETWLAEMFDYTLAYEQKQYGWTRPVSFTNWVTTDLLDHPSEPSAQEDLVSVDPNVISLTDKAPAGQFASYHVYPYYPDFMNYEPAYRTYKDWRGEPNTYAAYLAELKAAHKLPVLIAEFGVPSSRGLTHENPLGWNQGFLSEQEQGRIDARLYEDIVKEGMMGGLVFTWQDEWFKRTWNTMDLDDPERRPYWSNAQTNEQQFGLLSFDRHKIRVDGSGDDWDTHVTKPLYAKEAGPLQPAGDSGDGQRTLAAMYADHDERYLYLRLDYAEMDTDRPFADMNTLIALDTVPGQGNTMLPFGTGVRSAEGIDFVIRLSGTETSEILVDSYYDVFQYQYGNLTPMLPPLAYPITPDSGHFHKIRLALNKSLTIPSTGEQKPFTSYETGRLRHGNGNPEADNYDSLADFYVNPDQRRIELRIPWQLLNIKDPSGKLATGDVWKKGIEAVQPIEGIRLAALTYKPGQDGAAVALPGSTGGLRAADAFPSPEAGELRNLAEYRWEGWTVPEYKERLKQSYYILQELYGKY